MASAQLDSDGDEIRRGDDPEGMSEESSADDGDEDEVRQCFILCVGLCS